MPKDTSAIGQLLLRGWCMTAEHCITPDCLCPLMENKRGDGEILCAVCKAEYERDGEGSAILKKAAPAKYEEEASLSPITQEKMPQSVTEKESKESMMKSPSEETKKEALAFEAGKDEKVIDEEEDIDTENATEASAPLTLPPLENLRVPVGERAQVVALAQRQLYSALLNATTRLGSLTNAAEAQVHVGFMGELARSLSAIESLERQLVFAASSADRPQ